jgi:hypothetical protein
MTWDAETVSDDEEDLLACPCAGEKPALGGEKAHKRFRAGKRVQSAAAIKRSVRVCH